MSNGKNGDSDSQKILLGKEDPLRKEILEFFGTGIPEKEALADENQVLSEEVKYLQNRLRTFNYQKSLKEALQKPSKLPYWFAGAAFAGLCIFLGITYPRSQVQISFTFDAGTITGGVLVGSAAVIAANAYARKSTRLEGNERNQRSPE